MTTALKTSPALALAPLTSTRHRETAMNAADHLMSAIVATGYGAPDVLKLVRRQKPVPKSNEVLVKVHATNVTAADSMLRRGDPAYARLFLGLTKPKAAVPGTGIAGVIEQCGADVTQFKTGDAVFGEAGLNFGAHAEYVAVPVDGVLLKKPADLSFTDAATFCDGPLTSYNFLYRMAQVQPGDRVLINGASGALGTAAVQIAKHFGAEVIGVCSTKNVALVASLGADHVIDYTQEDFTAHRDRYDVIYDTVGKSSFPACKRALRKKGRYLSPVLKLSDVFRMLWTGLFDGKKVMFDATGARSPDELRPYLKALETMALNGQLRTLIERTYTLEQMHQAHAHVDSGRKTGSIVVVMDDAELTGSHID